jgi:hypothetical protein
MQSSTAHMCGLAKRHSVRERSPARYFSARYRAGLSSMAKCQTVGQCCLLLSISTKYEFELL